MPLPEAIAVPGLPAPSSYYSHVVRHGDTLYLAGMGASDRSGDIIGLVGSTGRATGSHLHYEILANGRLINPLQLLTQPADH